MKLFFEQLAFLIVSSSPLMKNIAQNSKHSLWQLIFTVFHISTLMGVMYTCPQLAPKSTSGIIIHNHFLKNTKLKNCMP